MNEAAKEARKAYMKKWRKEHPDLIRAQQERYWTKKMQQLEDEQKNK